MRLEDDVCEECAARRLVVSFQKKEGREDLRGCVVCDDDLDALLETRFVFDFL